MIVGNVIKKKTSNKPPVLKPASLRQKALMGTIFYHGIGGKSRDGSGIRW